MFLIELSKHIQQSCPLFLFYFNKLTSLLLCFLSFFLLFPHQICKKLFINPISGRLNHISSLFCPLVARLVNIRTQAFWWRLSHIGGFPGGSDSKVSQCETPERFNHQALSLISRLIFTLYKEEIHFPPYQCLNLFMPVCMLSHISHVQLFAALQTVVGQAPLSMGFSRQKYWSGLPWSPPGVSPNP